jgi:uncharacterized RDD family membrane protein YckC
MSAGDYGKASGPRAGFWRRFGAYLIDAILVGIVGGILEIALKGVGYALAILLYLAYFTYFEGSTGQTPGKRTLGIRVVDFETGRSIGYGRAVIRSVGRYLSALVILIGYLWMLWDREKQTWHDKLAGSVVVPLSAYPVDYDAASRASSATY